MINRKEHQQQRRINSAYLTSAISITLVLFSLGLLGMILLHAHQLSNYILENIGFEIIMQENVKEAEILQLQKTLDAEPYVKSTEYITREKAVNRLTEMLGDEFTQFLGEENNPLLPSIDVRFKAAWANSDSIAKIEAFVLSNKQVKEVYYQKSMVHLINANLRGLTLFMTAFSLLLLFIALALINNTVRLSVMAKRFIIRSMQLVGATESFIRKPFVLSGMALGAICGALAILLLYGLTESLLDQIPELRLLTNVMIRSVLYLTILVLGILITSVSTHVAVSRYLNRTNEQLHH